MRSLVWFRNDLRTADNTALHEACRVPDDAVIAIFVITPRQWKAHDWGPPKVDFVLRCADALSQELARLGIPLLVRETASFSGVPRLLLDVAKAHRCDALFYNEEYEVNEIARDHATSGLFQGRGLKVHACADQTILPPDRMRTGAGEFFKVFTPFRNAWLAELQRSGLPRPRTRPRRRGGLPEQPDPVPERLRSFVPAGTLCRLWPAGERAARRRLDRFVEKRIECYDVDRNFPDVHGTSTLSPWLACGAISARQCLISAVAANEGEIDTGNRGATTWISELAWREFYRHVLVGHPRVCRDRAFRRETDRLVWSNGAEDFRAWREGRTGVPIVDAAMRQLRQTGWMHNRLRMISAMFLTKDLFVDWRWGERIFMRRLVDGDFASNNGGWQWSASTGCDAAPYFRVFNPVRQSERWDPEGRFIRRFCPELTSLGPREVHQPSKLGPQRLARLGYPEPIVDHGFARERVIEAFRALRS